LGDRGLIFAVFCDEKIEGVDYCGGEEIIQKFLSGDIKKCHVCICTKKYFPLVSSKIGKILGRRRIMPDARFGTVTEDNREAIEKAITSFKRGRMNFRANKNVVHSIIGKLSFDSKDLIENFNTLVREVRSMLPEKTSLGKIYVAPTMGSSVEVLKGGSV
jgi:large subunit ribosomal protein L1